MINRFTYFPFFLFSFFFFFKYWTLHLFGHFSQFISINYTFKLKFINVEVFDVVLHQNKTFFDVFIILLIIIFLIGLLLGQATLLNKSLYPNSTFDAEKYSPYECGFAPFKTERSQFDIKFYLVALLFLVFDVELMFFLPYCLSYFYLGLTGYMVFIFFFSILLIGFLIEWSAGMLIWKSDTLIENYETKTYQLDSKDSLQSPESLSVDVLDLIVEREEMLYYLYDFYYNNSFRYEHRWVNWVLYWRPYQLKREPYDFAPTDVNLNIFEEIVPDFYPKRKDKYNI